MEMEDRWECSDVVKWIEKGFYRELEDEDIDRVEWTESWFYIIRDMKTMTRSLPWIRSEEA